MNTLNLFFLVLSIIALSSCATILSNHTYPVRLTSEPQGAEVTVTNSAGEIVFNDLTPATAKLEASEGYFKQARYKVTFSKEGFQERSFPITASLDGWFFGNILLGGVIGMLIVDPVTGAMYKLDSEQVNAVLKSNSGAVDREELRIYDLCNIPEEWKDHLVKIK